MEGKEKHPKSSISESKAAHRAQPTRTVVTLDDNAENREDQGMEGLMFLPKKRENFSSASGSGDSKWVVQVDVPVDPTENSCVKIRNSLALPI